jgi:integrase
MGNLYKHGRVWYYRFMWQGKRYHGSTGCEDKSRAQRWLKEFRDGLVDGTRDSRGQSTRPTLLQALERMEADQTTGHSPSHRANIRGDVEAHMQALHVKPLDEITTQDVKIVLNGFLAKKNVTGRYNTPGGANHVLRSLGSIMAWAEENEVIERRAYRVKGMKLQETPKTTLTLDQLGPFLAAVEQVAPPDARDLIILEAGMGLRESEARHALVEHVNLSRMEFTPYHPEVGTKGKEAKPVPIPEWTKPHLLRMVGGRNAGLLVPGKGANGAHGRLYTLQYVKLAGAVIGVMGITPHRLRNTYATLLSAQGVPPREIQEALRHKHLKTTLPYLVAQGGDAVRRGADRIGSLAGLVQDLDTDTKDKRLTLQ